MSKCKINKIRHDGLCMYNRMYYLTYPYTCVISYVIQVSANPIVNLIQPTKRSYTSRNFLVEQLEFGQATLTKLRLRALGSSTHTRLDHTEIHRQHSKFQSSTYTRADGTQIQREGFSYECV